jgi:AGZA family xanthine/uracil permease-like MFS transporter
MLARTRARLESYFEFKSLATNWRTEILAGVTTFVTMAYIIFVNPSILQETGMPFKAVVAATCFCAAFGSILMGAYARYPIALAPGMGLNAYFTYTVVKAMHVPWEAALGAVFLSGVAFVILTFAGVRQMIVEAIPTELYAAVAAGIGLFIAVIGLRNAGIIVASPDTLVALGNLRDKNTVLALFGLLLMSALLAWRVRAAILIGIVATTLVGAVIGVVHWGGSGYSARDILATAGKLDVRSALSLGFFEIIFVFLFVDLFDNVGTLVGVGKKAALFDEAHRIPRMQRIFLCDASATIAGSLAGTSTVVSYIESAAGVVAGGRSGVTAIVTGLLFAVSLFVAPDDVARGGDSLERRSGGDPRVSNYRHDPAHVQHREWARVWVHSVCFVTAAARRISPDTLAGVCARASLHRALYLSGPFRLTKCWPRGSRSTLPIHIASTGSPSISTRAARRSSTAKARAELE